MGEYGKSVLEGTLYTLLLTFNQVGSIHYHNSRKGRWNVISSLKANLWDLFKLLVAHGRNPISVVENNRAHRKYRLLPEKNQ